MRGADIMRLVLLTSSPPSRRREDRSTDRLGIGTTSVNNKVGFLQKRKA